MTIPANVPLSPLDTCPDAYRHGNTSIDFADRGRRGLRSEQRSQATTIRARLLSWRLVTALQQAVGPTARDRASIEEFGSAAFAISADQPSKLKETIDKHKVGFRLLSDSDMAAAQSFRVAYRLDDATLAQLNKYGIDVEEASGQTHHMLPVPAVFFVATNGLIQFEYVNLDIRYG